MRLVAGARLPVHAIELLLKGGVEDDVAFEAKKPELRSHALEPLHDERLLLGQLDSRRPSVHGGTSWP
jgi:hypothetical protein